MRKDELGGTEPAPAPAAAGAGAVLLSAVWFGTVTGLGEAALRLGQKFVLGDLIRISREFLWMAPAANVFLFIIVGAILIGGGRLWPRLRGTRAVVCTFAFLTLFAWALLPWRIPAWAAALLCAGLAWQLSRPIAARFASLHIGMRRTMPALVGLVVLLGVGLNVAGAAIERRRLAALPPDQEGVPNVILIIWDTVRAASLGLHGHDRPTTPNLERLAATGVTFDKAIATSSWTLPSHASMFTGRLPHQTSATWYRALDGTHRTIAEALAGHGYRTAGFAANTLYVEWEHGLARGFSHFEGYRITPGQIIVTSSLGARLLHGRGGWSASVFRRLLGDRRYIGRKTADMVNADFMDWLDAQPADRPFFAFLNFFDAHLPYAPPPPYDTIFGPRRPETTFLERVRRAFERDGFWDMPAQELAAEVAAYEGAITYLDARLGALLDALEQRGVRDNTLIMITSDHGEEFGEHGTHEHGTNLYLTQTHVPLVISLPGVVPSGERVAEPASLRDIAATIMDLTGISAPSFPGATLARYWEAGGSRAGPVTSELAPGRNPDRRMTSLFADGFHYIRNIDGRAELYDLNRDRAERTDLAKDSAMTPVLDRMSAANAALAQCDTLACCCTVPAALLLAPGADPPQEGDAAGRRRTGAAATDRARASTDR